MAKVKQQQPAQKQPARVGRPPLGSFRLHAILPQQVLDELVREENASGIYRTRVAANVLCAWAKQQRAQ